MGVNAEINCPAVIDRKIAMGTKNLAKEPAMTREQAVRAVMTGVEMAELAASDGVDIIGVGEMGNRKHDHLLRYSGGPSPERAPRLSQEREAALPTRASQREKAVIDSAIKLHRPDRNDVIDVLSKVGGFDVAAMCGVFLGSALVRKPVVVDGFISIVAALCAVRLCPDVRHYLIPSHQSFERGYQIAAKELGFDAYLLLGMRLGEGSGCPLAFEIVDAACTVINDMATFAEAEINDDYLEEIRKKDSFTV